MRMILRSSLLAPIALGLTIGSAFAGGGKGADCGAVGSQVQAAASQDPGGVLAVVNSAALSNEACACEIVKGAIVGSQADNETVGEIVYTAVSAAPGMAATIAECAIAVAPGASAEIKSALRRALDGDEGGDAFGAAPVDVRGIYLIPPVAPSAALTEVLDDDDDTRVRTLTIDGVRVRAVIDSSGNVVDIVDVVDRGSNVIIRRGGETTGVSVSPSAPAADGGDTGMNTGGTNGSVGGAGVSIFGAF